jgi:hypothetical protein
MEPKSESTRNKYHFPSKPSVQKCVLCTTIVKCANGKIGPQGPLSVFFESYVEREGALIIAKVCFKIN